jgi:hypothetical protein
VTVLPLHNVVPRSGSGRVDLLMRNTRLPKATLEKLFGVSRVATPMPQPRHAGTKEPGRPGRRATTAAAWQDGRDPRLVHEKMREAAGNKTNLGKLLKEGR